jgi:hypothetical protein
VIARETPADAFESPNRRSRIGLRKSAQRGNSTDVEYQQLCGSVPKLINFGY